MSDRDDRVTADEAFAMQAKAAFDESVEALDAATLSRLNRARHEAVEASGKTFLNARWQMLVPAGGVAAAAVVAVMLVVGQPGSVGQPAPSSAADLEILLEVDDLEMLEDLEFYAWMDMEPETASNNG